MALIAFYLMAAVTLVSALMVIMARNPVHSVLWLILAFFSSAGLFVLIGAEFLAMLLVVVYVGAVAVLFLFVVMMLDVDFVELKDGTLRYWPFAMLVGIVFAAEIFMRLFWACAPVRMPLMRHRALTPTPRLSARSCIRTTCCCSSWPVSSCSLP